MSTQRNTPPNLFAGPRALPDYLHPKNLLTPLVELPSALNPFSGDHVVVLAKMTCLLPHTIKMFAAYGMLAHAQRAGLLRGKHTLVENSSGGTIRCLGALAPYFGIWRVHGIIPRDTPLIKLGVIQLTGVHIEFDDGRRSEPSGIEKAAEMGKREGFINLGQYNNPANALAYQEWLAPQIREQTAAYGGITDLYASIGTGGTIIGLSNALRPEGVRVIGVVPGPKQAVPGTRTLERLKGVKNPWREAIDASPVEVETEKSYLASIKLCHAGLMVGPSGGAALEAVWKRIESEQKAGSLDAQRNKLGKRVVVFICPDGPELYPDKYSTLLNPTDLATEV